MSFATLPNVMRSILLFAACLLPLAGLASAADVTGKWVGEMHMGGGGSEQPVEVTFDFKVDGSSVEGSVSSERGEFPIQDGKLEGDSLTFTLEIPGGRILYDGLVKPEGIDFLADFEGRGRTDQFLAKRPN